MSMIPSSKSDYVRLKNESVASFKGKFTDEEDQKPATPTLDEPCACFPTMTYKQRLIGFGFCVVLGAAMYGLAVLFFVQEDLVKFAVVYTFGNIVALGGTFFLMGPMSQLKRMLKPFRIIPAIIYLLCMVLTLVFALALESIPLTLVFMVLQACAMLFYSLTFLPFARTLFKEAAKVICPCIPKDAFKSDDS